MSQRLTFISATFMWTVTIGYVPIKQIADLDGWGGLQTVTGCLAVTLTLMYWLGRTGGEFRIGYLLGYQHGLAERRQPIRR